MIKSIIHFDKWLFSQINQSWVNPVFDRVMPFLRQPEFWAPFYLFMIFFSILNFPKKAFFWILSAGLTVTLTDLVSSRVIKPLVGRLRPCNDPSLANSVRLLTDHCGQNGSFTSSHAANHFGMAVFFFLTLQPIMGKYSWLFFLWAALVSYAQVYVGVHFPVDVIGGALLGIFTGSIIAKLYHHYFGAIVKK
jgi:undecaprenyl-diphosphatase